MKKIISLLMVLCLMTLILCACSTNPAGQYVGQYTNSSGDTIEKELILYENNSFKFWTRNLNYTLGFDVESGTYTIESSQLTLRYGSDSDKEYYEWNGSEIITDDGLTLKKR